MNRYTKTVAAAPLANSYVGGPLLPSGYISQSNHSQPNMKQEQFKTLAQALSAYKRASQISEHATLACIPGGGYTVAWA